MQNLFWELIIRISIIVGVTDALMFYLLATNSPRVLRFGYGGLTVLVILVTLVPIIINVWYVLWRHGLL
jgi:hypothetical protein